MHNEHNITHHVQCAMCMVQCASAKCVTIVNRMAHVHDKMSILDLAGGL